MCTSVQLGQDVTDLGRMPTSFLSSHRFIFRRTYANTCKPFYSLPLSPSCLIISVGFIISPLFWSHRPHCSQYPCCWTLRVKEWLAGLLFTFLWQVSTCVGPEGFTACLRTSGLAQWPWKTGFTLLISPSRMAYGQWLPHPGDLSNWGGHSLSITWGTWEWAQPIPEQMERPPLPLLSDAHLSQGKWNLLVGGQITHRPSMSWLPGYPSPAWASWASWVKSKLTWWGCQPPFPDCSPQIPWHSGAQTFFWEQQHQQGVCCCGCYALCTTQNKRSLSTYHLSWTLCWEVNE